MKSTFFCIDAHTCGNPVRLIAGGGPILEGKTMLEKRACFLQDFDWIRRGLMFEPRGHDMMSGSLLYPPAAPENDMGILFLETSGCLPMCGHGTIGTVTAAIEAGLIQPKKPGQLRLETPAGVITVTYQTQNEKVSSVRLVNVPSFLVETNLSVDCPGIGRIHFDVAYGGNFYAIIDPQEHFKGLQHYTGEALIPWSRRLRAAIADQYHFEHPDNPLIQGIHHIMWTGSPLDPASTARCAVFYGEKAIDRSPCGTGTSARLAQWYAKGMIRPDQSFIHESIIGSKFIATIDSLTQVGGKPAICPAVQGWARVFGHNTITIDTKDDPFALGFTVL